MKRIFIYKITMLVLFFIVLTACSSNDANFIEENKDNASVHYTEGAIADEGMEFDNSRTTYNTTSAIELEERKVIYTGDISIEVSEFRETEAYIEGKITSFNGYIVESSFYDNHDGHIYGRLT